MKQIVEVLKDKLVVHNKEGSREWCVFEANHKRYLIELEGEYYRFQVAQYNDALLSEIVGWVTILNTRNESSLSEIVALISKM